MTEREEEDTSEGRWKGGGMAWWERKRGRHFVFRDLSATFQTKTMKILPHPLLPDVLKSLALFEGSLSSPAWPSDKSRVEIQMSVEQWWNDKEEN